MATYDSGIARSRLDRVYANHHVSDQMDAKFGCACLDWVPHLSNHRPVVFYRFRQTRTGASPILDESIVKDASWAFIVTQLFQESLNGDPDRTDPLTKLFLLKQAINSCSRDMVEVKRRKKQQEQCVLIEDKIGWTMKAVRAIEKGHRGVLLRCIRAYPTIGQYINPYQDDMRSGTGFDALRDYAVGLHKVSLLEEIQDIQQDARHADEGAINTRRSRAQFKLNKLRPGSCCAVGAVRGRDGIVISDPRLIVNELREYWGDIFSGSSCNQDLLRKWIDEDPSMPSWNGFQDCWIPSREDLAKVVQAASKSAPGPDGIPYSAWKALGELGVNILYDMAMTLTEGDMDSRLGAMDLCSQGGVGPHSFNLGNMVFLPKKSSGVHPLFGEFYSPGDVRPLVIVNTDNRIISNAFRRQWEPVLDTWISRMQQGFLPGRSMASNIIDVDSQAQCTSLEQDRGAILLLDFRAAFPSVSQEFLHSMIAHLNLPGEARWVVKNLYCSHRCNINFKDISEDGFTIGAGIRQGCPLSPLLFALVLDIVLRRLQRALPSATIRAFADDIGLVVQDIDEALPILHDIFRELEQIAGLALNKKKCILIPLWPSSQEQVSRELVTSYPEWADLQVSYSGTYLGVSIGQEGAGTFWDKARRKYLGPDMGWVWSRSSVCRIGIQCLCIAGPVLSGSVQGAV